MVTPDEIVQIAVRFSAIANQFCSVVDSASSLDRTELLSELYPILPALISQAIGLPDVSRDDDDELEGSSRRGFHVGGVSEQEWGKLYNFLKENWETGISTIRCSIRLRTTRQSSEP